MPHFPILFSPVQLGGVTVKNRLFSPAHGTTLGTRDGLVSDDLIRYHEARARGGVGLIILEGMNLHPTYRFPDLFLIADDDVCIPGLRQLGEALSCSRLQGLWPTVSCRTRCTGLGGWKSRRGLLRFGKPR